MSRSAKKPLPEEDPAQAQKADRLPEPMRDKPKIFGISQFHNCRTAWRAEFKAEARSCFQKGLAIWQDWTRRKVATPYAGRREAQALAYLASSGQP